MRPWRSPRARYCSICRSDRQAIASGADSSDDSRSARRRLRRARRSRRASGRRMRASRRPNIPRNISWFSPSLIIAWQLPAISKDEIGNCRVAHCSSCTRLAPVRRSSVSGAFLCAPPSVRAEQRRKDSYKLPLELPQRVPPGFSLEPLVGAAGTINRAKALRHNALAAEGAGVVVDYLAVIVRVDRDTLVLFAWCLNRLSRTVKPDFDNQPERIYPKR